MNRLLNHALRRLAAWSACAAVLLASFEDEALAAAAAARTVHDAATPSSDDEDKAYLFPDLSRPRAGDSESDSTVLFLSPRSVFDGAIAIVSPRDVDRVPGPASTGGPPLRDLLCVWRL